ncbi:rCG61294 [Rattus norvegicus]|uniref:RCG61294 n=1 Tax=Rattus norvegicus TaxID=10116 RepID=A6KE18_RAT|nr:rCG61294 [Rattus norvegicus]
MRTEERAATGAWKGPSFTCTHPAIGMAKSSCRLPPSAAPYISFLSTLISELVPLYFL